MLYNQLNKKQQSAALEYYDRFYRGTPESSKYGLRKSDFQPEQDQKIVSSDVVYFFIGERIFVDVSMDCLLDDLEQDIGTRGMDSELIKSIRASIKEFKFDLWTIKN